MASLMNRIQRFAKSEQGRKLTEDAKRMAKDPKTRARIDEARRKLTKRDRPH
jgi:hypothetical protein